MFELNGRRQTNAPLALCVPHFLPSSPPFLLSTPLAGSTRFDAVVNLIRDRGQQMVMVTHSPCVWSSSCQLVII